MARNGKPPWSNLADSLQRADKVNYVDLDSSYFLAREAAHKLPLILECNLDSVAYVFDLMDTPIHTKLVSTSYSDQMNFILNHQLIFSTANSERIRKIIPMDFGTRYPWDVVYKMLPVIQEQMDEILVLDQKIIFFYDSEKHNELFEQRKQLLIKQTEVRRKLANQVKTIK